MGETTQDTPKCHTCGQPATCYGRYEGRAESSYGCDDCCGHGNEDGACSPVGAYPAGSEPWTDLGRYSAWRATKCPELSPRDNLLDAALGFAGEAVELFKAVEGRAYHPGEILDELGDVLFYAAWVSTAVGPEINKPAGADWLERVASADWRTAHRDMVFLAGATAEDAKKVVFHGKVLNGSLRQAVFDACRIAHSLAVACGSSLTDVLRRNVAKLDRRYPGGFVAGGGRR